MTKITAQQLYKILKENYHSQLLTYFDINKSNRIEISEFAQGFMNRVLKITFFNNEIELSSFVGIFYNSNRYNSLESREFLIALDKIAELLREKGIPSRVAIKSDKEERVINLYGVEFHDKKRYFSLFELLSGKTLPWEAYTRRHLRSLGMMQGKIHSAFLDIYEELNVVEIGLIPTWSQYIKSDSGRLQNYLEKNNETILNKLDIELSIQKIQNSINNVSSFSCPYNDPEYKSQLIHGDFVRGNILFSDIKSDLIYMITGVMDFEKLMLANSEIDIARTLAFLIVDCKFKTVEDIIKYYLNEGYNTLGTVDNRQKKILFSKLENYMIYFWLRDFWKYLESNPYEDLLNNEHFMRTIKLLAERELIKFIT